MTELLDQRQPLRKDWLMVLKRRFRNVREVDWDVPQFLGTLPPFEVSDLFVFIEPVLNDNPS